MDSKNDNLTYFEKLIRARRSVRSYEDLPLAREDIEICIDAARQAPSACNKQPWEFIVIDDSALKESLCEKAFGGVVPINGFVNEAPVILVVIAHKDILTNRMAASIKGIPYYLLDIGAACEQLLLRAAEMGIGTCWLGWFHEKPIKKILSIPSTRKVVSLISMGYAKGKYVDSTEKTRKDLSEICSFNGYGLRE